VTTARLELTREQILGHRRSVGALDERLPPGPASRGRAAWAGLQDSVPRAALLSIHARVQGTEPNAWEDPSLVQLWGPSWSVYVVAVPDIAVFSLGRLADGGELRRKADNYAGRLYDFLDGRKMTYDEVALGLDLPPNGLRYAAPTGTVLIRWDGACQPTVWTVQRPDVDPRDARLELARRYLHVFGPATPAAFAAWAGIRPRTAGRAAFDVLGESLTPVRTPMGDAWILTGDEPSFRAPGRPAAPARLLPSGDAYTLLQGADRELLVPDPDNRRRLWTPRVWPGAVLVEGEVVGTWRRAQTDVTIESWRRLSPAEREAVESEAASMPLPGIRQRVRVSWDD
jgi:hypothetical protein